MTRIMVLIATAAVTCSLTCSAQAGSIEKVKRYIHCAQAANNRAGPKNCRAYQDSISCGKKAIQAMTIPGAVRDTRLALENTRIAARRDRCKVE
jgi:hypothetical protein